MDILKDITTQEVVMALKEDAISIFWEATGPDNAAFSDSEASYEVLMDCIYKQDDAELGRLFRIAIEEYLKRALVFKIQSFEEFNDAVEIMAEKYKALKESAQ